MHDWTKATAGTYHFFHQRWISALADALNLGGLPPGYFAMSERRAAGWEPDVLTLARPFPDAPSEPATVATMAPPPRARFVVESDVRNHARRADQLSIRVEEGEVVAVIEIVSPGNKDSREDVDSFVRKAVEFLDRGVHLVIVDPFPPGPRDPEGLHKVIWDEVQENSFAFPDDKPLTIVSYRAGETIVGHVEPIAVGDPLPEVPLFLSTAGRYVPCPLEASYQATWAVFPTALKTALEGASA